MGRRVAVVTGANRGIGFQVARQLLQHFHGDVIVTGRNSSAGKKACQELTREGLKPIWHELDVTQSASVRMFLEYITDNYGGMDLIVSNAGVIFPSNSQLSMHRQAELSIQTNFKGTVSMCKHFIPLLRPQARVVILSSELGTLGSLGPELRKKIDPEKISMYELELLSDKYLAAIKGNVWSEYGWPGKIIQAVGVFQNLLAHIIARDLRADQRWNILVNAGCPGVTSTDQMQTYLDEDGCLGGVKAQSAEGAANDIAWLALLPAGTESPNGAVVYQRKVVDITK